MMDLVTRNDLASQLIQACWDDPALKERLLENPKQVLQEMIDLGDSALQIPDSLAIRCVSEEPGEMVFVLPQNPEDSELGLEELEMVAGGKKGKKWFPKPGGPIVDDDDCKKRTDCVIRLGCDGKGVKSGMQDVASTDPISRI